VAEEVWDLAALHQARGEDRLRAALRGETARGSSPDEPAPDAVPRSLWHASPGSAG
jgi:hypothetical protein